jgi:hypothetical protein
MTWSFFIKSHLEVWKSSSAINTCVRVNRLVYTACLRASSQDPVPWHVVMGALTFLPTHFTSVIKRKWKKKRKLSSFLSCTRFTCFSCCPGPDLGPLLPLKEFTPKEAFTANIFVIISSTGSYALWIVLVCQSPLYDHQSSCKSNIVGDIDLFKVLFELNFF